MPQQFARLPLSRAATASFPPDTNYGVKLQEKLRRFGVQSELVYPGAPDVKHSQVHNYLIDTLKAPAARKS
jgi:hypothetical protein